MEWGISYKPKKLELEWGMSTQANSSESTTTKTVQEFFKNLNLDDDEKKTKVQESKKEFHEEEVEEKGADEEDDDDDNEEEEEEFSFAFALDGANSTQITAEDAFFNGQIKPVYPLFDQDLLLKEGIKIEDLIANDRLPNVKKVFVEADRNIPATASTSGDDAAAGPYCEWDKNAVVVTSPEGCKKSNSTGFSKIWRFKEFRHRSSSDGRDAFVFLNNASPPAATRKTVKKTEVPESKVNGGEGKVKATGEKGVKGKKVVKSKKALSPHEVYMRSKAREEERRRSYLPYRPEMVGFFTNVTGGGLTRNVHPF